MIAFGAALSVVGIASSSDSVFCGDFPFSRILTISVCITIVEMRTGQELSHCVQDQVGLELSGLP